MPAQYEVAFARYRQEPVGRRREARHFYLIGIGLATKPDGSEGELALESAWWRPAESVRSGLALAYVYDAIFGHAQQRWRLSHEPAVNTSITYACGSTITPEVHLTAVKRLQYAIEGKGRIMQLEASITKQRVALAPPVSLPLVASEFNFFAKAEVYSPHDHDYLVMYCKKESDTDDTPVWVLETEIEMSEAIAFSVNAVDQVGCTRHPSPPIKDLAFLNLPADQIDKDRATKSLFRLLRTQKPRLWRSIGGQQVETDDGSEDDGEEDGDDGDEDDDDEDEGDEDDGNEEDGDEDGEGTNADESTGDAEHGDDGADPDDDAEGEEEQDQGEDAVHDEIVVAGVGEAGGIKDEEENEDEAAVDQMTTGTSPTAQDDGTVAAEVEVAAPTAAETHPTKSASAAEEGDKEKVKVDDQAGGEQQKNSPGAEPASTTPIEKRAGSVVPANVSEPTVDSEPNATSSAKLDTDTPKAGTSKVDAPKVDTPKVDTPKVDTPKDDTKKDNTPKDDTPKDDTPKDDTPKDDTLKKNTSSTRPRKRVTRSESSSVSDAKSTTRSDQKKKMRTVQTPPQFDSEEGYNSEK